MEKFLNALERKFGRYAVPDLIKYVVIIYCAGAVIGLVNPYFYYQYLSLNMNAVFHGQIWRLFTFLLEPSGFSSGSSMGGFLIGIIFFFFQVNLFFLFGRSLEAAWGTFRFNMYIVSGFLFNIIAALILYLSPLHVSNYDSGMQYIYWSMFFAFALMNPDMEGTITKNILHENVDYTPYEGIQVKGWPVMTMVRGQAVVENERLQVPLGFGRYINRKPVKYTELLK